MSPSDASRPCSGPHARRAVGPRPVTLIAFTLLLAAWLVPAFAATEPGPRAGHDLCPAAATNGSDAWVVAWLKEFEGIFVRRVGFI